MTATYTVTLSDQSTYTVTRSTPIAPTEPDQDIRADLAASAVMAANADMPALTIETIVEEVVSKRRGGGTKTARTELFSSTAVQTRRRETAEAERDETVGTCEELQRLLSQARAEVADLSGKNIDLEVWRASAVDRAEQAEAERDEARATVEARERTIETLVRSWRMYRKRAEHAERQRDEARAEVEALQCCGNCDNWSYAHRHTGEYMLCSYDAEDRSREPSEPCGFAPSRWTEREA